MVLGAWIPIKSNCAYEIWQTLCLDDDGVVDVRTGVSHPWRSAGEQRAEEPLAAMWIYAVYLLPYILISYYDRYAMPLLGIKMLLVVYGFDAAISTLVKKRGFVPV